MSTTNVVGGPPSVQDTIRTMNQSIGQMMSFVNNQKTIAEQKREFDIGKGLSALETMANQAGGYNVLAKQMGSALPEMLQSFGMDSLQAQGFAQGLANIKMTPGQVTMETIKSVYAGGPNTPEYQQLFLSGKFGGDTSIPGTSTGIDPVGKKAVGLLGDYLNGNNGEETEKVVEGANGGKEEVAPAVVTDTGAAELAKAETERSADEAFKLSELNKERKELLDKAKLSRDAGDVTGVALDLTRRANAIEAQIEELGGTLDKSIESKNGIKPLPKIGGQGQITGLSSDKGLSKEADEKYNLNGNMSSFESSYTSKFARTPLPGVFPTGFYENENPDALNGGIPVTKAEFNTIQSPTLKDSSNLRLAEDFKTAAIPDDKRNSILNLMDSSYIPSTMESANLLSNYDQKINDYNVQVRSGQAPPIPVGERLRLEALHKVAEGFVNETGVKDIPENVQTLAANSLVDKALSSKSLNTLADDVNLIITASKNPSLATYFMPEAEKNRLENKKLSLETARLFANKEITQTNQVMAALNFFEAHAANQVSGNEGEVLAWETAVGEYKRIQGNENLSQEEKADRISKNIMAAAVSKVYGVMFGQLAEKPVGWTDVRYRSALEAAGYRLTHWGKGGTGVVSTFTFLDQNEEPSKTTVTDEGTNLLNNIGN